MMAGQGRWLPAFAVLVLATGLGAGTAVGYWLTARHYQPLLAGAWGAAAHAGEALAGCNTLRGSLEGQVGEQNLALQRLALAERQRAMKAKAAASQAHGAAEAQYQAANRLQQERTGGDPAAAAGSLIDQELGL